MYVCINCIAERSESWDEANFKNADVGEGGLLLEVDFHGSLLLNLVFFSNWQYAVLSSDRRS